jgi:hypothetical protein
LDQLTAFRARVYRYEEGNGGGFWPLTLGKEWPSVAGRVGLGASKAAKARRVAVIRALWFTDCTVAAIGERLGISGKTVSLLAKRAGLPPRHEYNRPMPKPSIFPPERRKGPQMVPPTPEQMAKKATNRRPSPPGQPDKAVVNLRLRLSRPIVERLSARAIREGVQLEAVVEEILGGVPE